MKISVIMTKVTNNTTTNSMCKLFDGTASLAPSESQIWLIDTLAPLYTDSKKSLHPALLPDKAFKSSWLGVNAEWHSTSFLLFQNELMDDLWDGNTQTSGQRLGNSFSVGLFLLIQIISSREREKEKEKAQLWKKNEQLSSQLWGAEMRRAVTVADGHTNVRGATRQITGQSQPWQECVWLEWPVLGVYCVQ